MGLCVGCGEWVVCNLEFVVGMQCLLSGVQYVDGGCGIENDGDD